MNVNKIPKKSYETPVIIHELDLETRAGSPAGDAISEFLGFLPSD